jgi:photosystem II stability/assembly factor-like uncharacterized protein
MRNIKSITITTALITVVILTGISFSDASPLLITHGVKGKHKHTLVKHKTRVKHHQSSAQTLGNAEMEEERGERMSPDMSNQWFEHHKDLATGTIPTGLTHSWHEHDLMMASKSASPLSGPPIDTVISIGPFTQGGRTRAILVSVADPSDNTFFAGGVDGGLWKSTNAGAYWSPVNDQAENLAVTCITQSPFSSNNIYYGTGENGPTNIFTPTAILGDGVFKSTDGGNTFTHVTPATGFPSYMWAIAHSMRDANTVYAGTSHGLWSTTDAGSNWTNLTIGGSTTGTIGDVLTFPSGYGVGSVIVSENGVGLFYYNGSSYTQITSSAFPTSGYAEVKLANCAGSPNVVYAAFASTAWYVNLVKFCKSTDGGATWIAATIPNTWGNYSSGGTTFTIMLGVNPNNSNMVTCGGIVAPYSTDGGTTWPTNVYLDGVHTDMHGYAIFHNSSKFLLGTDGGVTMFDWASITTSGTQLNNNYATTQFFGGGFTSSANYRTCVAGCQDNGTYRFTPGQTVVVPTQSGDGCWSYISQQNSNLAYVANQNTSGWNDGNHVLSVTTNLLSGNPTSTPLSVESGEPINFYNFYQSNYADGNQLYFRTNKGLWRTTDEGSTWTRLNQTGDDIVGIQFIGCTNATNPSVYFTSYVSPNAHFYRIANAQTFTPGIPTDLSASIPLAVQGASFGEISQTPSGGIGTSLFMCTTNYSSIPHIYKVTNANGSTPTWTNITGDLPSTLAVNEVQADPLTPTIIFAATDFGLYYTTNGGTNWIKDTRIPNTYIDEMQLRVSDRKLFLFTQGRGVWYCSLAAIGGIVQQASVEPTPATPQLQFSLYPNPATQMLTVNPQQQLSSLARIAIYSSDGRMISESAWNATGNQGQEVNISSLPSGAYFLQITDGNLVAGNKFVKM